MPACKALLIAIVFLGGAIGAGAQQFSLAPSYATGTSPLSVAAGNLNGDAFSDVAVANSGSNNVSVLLAKGDGTFQPAVNYTVGSAPAGVAMGDFNGNGSIDLVVANGGGSRSLCAVGQGSISVLLNNGSGAFSAQKVACTAMSSTPSSVAVGDFNGDHKLDVAVTNGGGRGSTVSVLLGNGDGTFHAPVSYAVGAGPSAVAVADFNGDGILDLAVTNAQGTYTSCTSSGTVSVLLGNGTGTFGTQSVNCLADGTDPVSVAVGDFNGDHKNDMAVASKSAIWVNIYLGSGDGTFQAPMAHEAGTYATGVAVGNFVTGSSVQDLVLSNDGSNTLTMLLGNGNGTFKGIVNYEAAAHAIAVAVGDFNGDGKPDAVVANQYSNTISVFIGRGDGTLVAPLSYGIGGDPDSVAVGDFYNNQILDLVAANKSAGSGNLCNPGCVSWLKGLGGGAFSKDATNVNVGKGPTFVAVADVNGDGKLDIAATNGVGNSVSVLLGNGNGVFSPPMCQAKACQFPVGMNPVSMASGFFNTDANLDLAVANNGSNNVSILLGTGGGFFQTAVNYTVGRNPTSVAAGDFNGDGILDLAVANGGDNDASILLGNGNGTFRVGTTFAAGLSPSAILAYDFNGDGKLDLAIANKSSNSVSILLGNGDGTFQPQVQYMAGTAPVALALADFNRDLIQDLAVAIDSSGAGNGVSLLYGTGGGMFSAPVNFAFGDQTNSVAVGDFNGDGAPDLTATSLIGGVTVLLNTGATGLVIAENSTP